MIEYTSNVLGANPQKKLRDLRHIKNRSDKDAYQQDYFYGEHASTLLMVSAISWWARDNYSTSLRFGMTRVFTRICITTRTFVDIGKFGNISILLLLILLPMRHRCVSSRSCLNIIPWDRQPVKAMRWDVY